MIAFSLTLFLTIWNGTSFDFAGTSHRIIRCSQSISISPLVPVLRASSSSDSAANDDLLDISGEETLLRINFSFDSNNGSSALAAVQTYTKSFPFAAVLPVQPLTYLPGE